MRHRVLVLLAALTLLAGLSLSACSAAKARTTKGSAKFSLAATATYSLSPNISAVNEGSSITFTLRTTNVPNNTKVAYTITGISAADLNSNTTTGNFVVSSNVASKSFTLKNDALTEGPETMTLTLNNGAATASATVNDTSLTKTYALTPSVSSVNEGSPVTFTLNTTGIANGTTLNYTVSGITSADLIAGALTGSFTVSGGVATKAFTLKADNLTEGQETMTLKLNNNAASANVIVNDTSLTPSPTGTPTYSLSSNIPTVDEGSSVTITLNTTNVANGTLVGYTVNGPGIDPSDFTAGAMTGNFTVNNNTASVAYTLNADDTTESAETMTLILNNGKASASVIVNDTSLTPSPTDTPTYFLSSNIPSVNEGAPVTFTLSTTNVANGTVLGYTVTGISATDLISGALTGNFTVNNDTASAAFTLSADQLTEGMETMSLGLDNGAASRSVTVNDTSLTPSSSSTPTSTDNISYTGSFDPGTGVHGDNQLTVGGVVRHYWVYIPTSLPNNAPILFVFHGTDGDAYDDGLVASGAMTMANTNKVIVVALQARTMTTGDWDNHTAGQIYYETYPNTSPDTNNDLMAVRAGIVAAQKAYGGNTNRVYSMGFSNGAFFTVFTAMTMPDKIAAFAENSGGLVNVPTTGSCDFFAEGVTSCAVMATMPGYCSTVGTEKPATVPTSGRKPAGYIAHANDDVTVSPAYSCNLAARMNALGYTTSVNIRNGGGHAWPNNFASSAWPFISQFSL